MGCDKAVLIETPHRVDVELPHLQTAAVLTHLMKQHRIDVLLAGKQAIDDDSGLVPSMTAAMLGGAQALCAAKVERTGGGLQVRREVDGGSEVVDVTVPCVVSTDLRLNVPRYATLPNIMKAKKKPLEVKSLADVFKEASIDGRERFRVVQVTEPKERRAGVKVDSVETLMQKLREEAKVIP